MEDDLVGSRRAIEVISAEMLLCLIAREYDDFWAAHLRRVIALSEPCKATHASGNQYRLIG